MTGRPGVPQGGHSRFARAQDARALNKNDWLRRQKKTMHRRKLMRLAGTGMTSGALAAPLAQFANATAAQKPSTSKVPKKALMKVGTQNVSADESLKVLAALGVNHICSTLPSARLDAQWSVEGLTKLRERFESFGIKLEIVPLPLSSSYITKAENPNIMLGRSPQRDREIDDLWEI